MTTQGLEDGVETDALKPTDHEMAVVLEDSDTSLESAAAVAEPLLVKTIPSAKDVVTGLADNVWVHASDEKCVQLTDIEGRVAAYALTIPVPSSSNSSTIAEDPWGDTDLNLDDDPQTYDGPNGCWHRLRGVLWLLGCILGLLTCLYSFVCVLGLLSSAFRLLGGKAAGEALSNNLVLQSPVACLMVGVLVTVLVQSSSTSTSIVVTLVASGVMDVQMAIPIIMGANIGTSVTNTIVSMTQCFNKGSFCRAFGGATVHDMFNWLTVLILLPIEIASGYLYHFTKVIVGTDHVGAMGTRSDFLKKITNPVTNLIIMLDKNIIKNIAIGNKEYIDKSLIKVWCKYEEELENSTEMSNGTYLHESINNGTVVVHSKHGVEKCQSLFSVLGLNDAVSGIILLCTSIIALCICLVLMVKLLNHMLKGRVARVIRKTVNADFPGKLSFLTGYVAILVGAGMTMILQSSSIFTSALTPLVGMGVLSIDRMYPLCLGANIGTTGTGILAALAASGDSFKPALQIALCHLFFNISGIILFYPVPFMRKIPINLAKLLGETTAEYRWFAAVYLAAMFFIIPGLVFALSLAGSIVLLTVGMPIFIFTFIIVIINILQRKKPNILPQKMRTWNYLPLWMHSLDPVDRHIVKVIDIFKQQCCCAKYCCKGAPEIEVETISVSNNGYGGGGGGQSLVSSASNSPYGSTMANRCLLQKLSYV